MQQSILDRVTLDAGEAAFFSRELEHVIATTYDVQYPELMAVQLLPVTGEAGPGAETIVWQSWDRVGFAKIIANYADDLPRSDIKGVEHRSPVRSIGNSFGYNLQEIRAAMMAGRPLETRRADATRRAHEEEVDRIGFDGDANHGLLGFIGHPNVPTGTVVAGVGGTTWVDKTADEILFDMNDIFDDMLDLTKGIERGNTLLLPIAQHSLISTMPRSTTSDTTVLQFFQRNRPGVTVIPVYKLKGKGAGGADIMIAYNKNPTKLGLHVPQPFEQLPPEQRGLEWIVNCHSRIGGVVVHYPLSVSVRDGI